MAAPICQKKPLITSWREWLIIRPQEGSFFTPRFRKERITSALMAPMKSSEKLMNIRCVVFGMMCLSRMRILPKPTAVAAWTYSSSRSLRTSPRITRQGPIQKVVQKAT